jgi:hypothetical protein
MSITLLAMVIFSSIFAGLGMAVLTQDNFKIKNDLIVFITIIVSFVLAVWIAIALCLYPENKLQITYIPIIDFNNSPFFRSPNGKIIPLEQDKKYVDVNKFQIEYTETPSMFVYGIYVVKDPTWKIVPKNIETP